MKAIQFQKYSKNLLPFAIICGLVLVFTYGFPIAGSDWLVANKLGDGGVEAWLDYTASSGGNYLSAFLTAMLVDVPLLRHILTAALICCSLILLIPFCRAEKAYLRYSIVALALAAPAGIFSHTYGWVQGASVTLLPAFLTALLIFSTSDLLYYKGRKKSWKIPLLFLNGLVCQFFSEGIGIAVLLLSLIYLLILTKKHGFSWHLAAHFFGCVLGCTLNLLITGGTDMISGSFYIMLDQLSLALDSLFIHNLFLMGMLTFVCLMLIQPVRSERSKNCERTLMLLLISYCLFVVLGVASSVFAPYRLILRFLAIAKLIAAAAYGYGILRTIQHYVSKDVVLIRVRVCLICIAVFVLVFSMVGTANEAYLYLPHLCIVAMIALLFQYSVRHYSRFEKSMGKTVIAAAVIGILLLAFVSVSNSYASSVAATHTKEQIQLDAGTVSLPEAPFPDYAMDHGQNMGQYYYVQTPGDVQFQTVPYAQWDWVSYQEAHNVPVIEEYDEEKEKLEEEALELEEDLP